MTKISQIKFVNQLMGIITYTVNLHILNISRHLWPTVKLYAEKEIVL